MTFPTDAFSQIDEPVLVADVRIPRARLNRNRTIGHKSPYWMIALTTSPLEYNKGMALNAYLNSLMGAYTKFDLPNPYPQEHSNGLTTVAANVLAGQDNFTIKGLDVNTAGAIKAGYFIRFGNHDNIYQVVLDVDTTASNEANVTITPALEQRIYEFDTVYIGDDVVFPVCMEDRSTATISASNGKFMTTSIELITQI